MYSSLRISYIRDFDHWLLLPKLSHQFEQEFVVLNTYKKRDDNICVLEVKKMFPFIPLHNFTSILENNLVIVIA